MLNNKVFYTRGRRFIAGTSTALVLGLVGATGAFADDPSLNGYGGPGGDVQGTVDQGGTLPPAQLVAPATTPGGNEVLGENASGGKVPAGTKGGGTAPSTASGAPPVAQAEHRLVGNLPFTGLDLALLAAAGLGLAGLGLGLRRLTSHQPQAG